MLPGLMQDRPLLVFSLIEHAEHFHPEAEIVSRTAEGPIHRTNYAGVGRRARQLAQALEALGVRSGERIATLAWNGYRHLELYYGVSGIGAVLHTINPRQFPEQIEYVANHAEDQYLFFDITFAPLVERLAAGMTTVKAFIAMTDRTNMPVSSIPNLLCYEDLIACHDGDFRWPQFEERTAAALCYTAGTTGQPKGVLYSHRSTVLHAFAICAADGLGISARDTALLAVPMFHVLGWGIPYAGAMAGARLVMPGPAQDGRSLYELLREQRVTRALGMPPVWNTLFKHVRDHHERPRTDLCLTDVVIGGMPVPPAMVDVFADEFGATVRHAWGMTETSPLGTVCNLLPKHGTWSESQRRTLQTKQGRPVYGVDLRITDDAGHPLPHDGSTTGRLRVRGPWVASGYYREAASEMLDADGYFDTGDVATLDPDGYLQITDRAPDAIRSRGEWISSVEIERVAVGHPGVAEAAAIAVVHPRWQERPLLVAVLKPGVVLSREEVLAYLTGKVDERWLPDDVAFVDQLPHTATGKLNKSELRKMFRDYALPTA